MKAFEIFQLIYSLGQVLDILGAYLVFRYGISPHIQKYLSKLG
jgi:hypothetical protein